MGKEKLDRISFLAKKGSTVGINDVEKNEQELLRAEYRMFRRKAMLSEFGQDISDYYPEELAAAKLIAQSSPRPHILLEHSLMVLWSSRPDVFIPGENYRDILGSELFPAKLETILSMRVAGKEYAAIINPLGKCYFASLFEDGDCVMLMNRSSVITQISRGVMGARSDLARIVNVNEILTENTDALEAMTGKSNLNIRELIGSETRAVSRLLAHICNLDVIFAGKTLDIGISSRLNIAETLRIILTETKSLCNRKIEYNEPDGGAVVNAHSNFMTVLLMNIVQNAVKFSPAGSTITVKLSKEDGECRISIVNDIDAAKAEAAATGLGLGQYYSKTAAHLIGGRFEHYADNGSYFAILTFPLLPDLSSAPLVLNSSYSEYVTEKYKPVHLFLMSLQEENA